MLTYEDYLLLPEDGQRHEIIAGKLYVTPPPFVPHQRLSMRLSARLGLFVERSSLGEIFTAPLDVLLSPHDIVQPDLLFISDRNAMILAEDNVQGAPDLVIEILSQVTRERDEGIKLERYGALGVAEYWMFDTDLKSARIFRRHRDQLQLAAELSAAAGDVLTSPLLTGLDLRLDEVFR
ncbi:MAG TPA: Uma2 family endonuclease [Thermoanaerobaculia bacterium]